MPGLNTTLEIARSTLLNTQIAIQTTSHNIANADNKAYARQKALMETNPAYNTRAGWLGAGANVASITQSRDIFIEMRLMQSISGESRYTAFSLQLSNTQSILSDNGEFGITSQLGMFWESWDVLVQDPTSPAAKSNVYQSARHLADSLRAMDSEMETIATQKIPGEINATVNKVSGLLDRIADLNQAIMQNEHPGHQANDLRDMRYQAIKDLSELIPVQMQEGTNGSLDIRTKDGSADIALVQGAVAGSISYVENTGILTFNQPDGTSVSSYTQQPGTTSFPPSDLRGGKLAGLVEALRKVDGYTDADGQAVNGYLQDLRSFAASLASEVNAALGGNVFSLSGADSSSITAGTDFLENIDPAMVTVRARNIAALQDKPDVAFTGHPTPSSFLEFLSALQERVGQDIQSADNDKAFAEVLRTELEAQQQSVSGVSLDEEMVDMIKHQHIYQAAAKIVQQTANMLDKIIEMV